MMVMMMIGTSDEILDRSSYTDQNHSLRTLTVPKFLREAQYSTTKHSQNLHSSIPQAAAKMLGRDDNGPLKGYDRFRL